jgi:hypothetical protein
VRDPPEDAPPGPPGPPAPLDLRDHLRLGAAHQPPARVRHEGHLAAARGALDEATEEAAWAEGRGLPLERAVAPFHRRSSPPWDRR